MTTSTLITNRHFTDAARAAAAESRRLKRASPIAKDVLDVFAVRFSQTGRTFSWQIRRYGSLVLERGADLFGRPAGARNAGEAVMADS